MRATVRNGAEGLQESAERRQGAARGPATTVCMCVRVHTWVRGCEIAHCACMLGALLCGSQSALIHGRAIISPAVRSSLCCASAGGAHHAIARDECPGWVSLRGTPSVAPIIPACAHARYPWHEQARRHRRANVPCTTSRSCTNEHLPT